jgi:N utilization substance protein A
MTILLNNNIVTFEEALSKGAKGLLELPGIGPKKATGLIELAEKIQERIDAAQILKTEIENPEGAYTEQSDDVTEKDQKKIEELEESISSNEEEPEDEEISIQELSNLQSEILEILKANGFETLAELSVTALDELVAIEGLDESSGKEILESVKQHLGNAKNV